METLWQDLRYGIRMLLEHRGFTAAAVLTLALGIGANSAIFSVVNAVLLQPLPFHDPDRLVLIWGEHLQTGWPQLPLSFPNFSDLREQSLVFEETAAWSSYTQTRFNVTLGGEPEQIQYALVSANFFKTLGVKPVLGRTLSPEEDSPGSARVVLVSYDLWQRRFSGDASLVGKSLALEGQAYEVIGILPSGFRFVTFPKEPEIWVPLVQDPLDPTHGKKYARGAKSLGVLARLKPDVSLAQARAETDAIARRLEQQHAFFNQGWSLRVAPLHEQVVQNLRKTLLLLSGAVGLVLLIACSNVTNLLLVRAKSRQRELAIRAALGAGRIRLVRQLLSESVILALLGGALGLLVAFWGIDLLAYLSFKTSSAFIPYKIPRQQIAVDANVLGFTFALSLLTGLIFGLLPSVQATKPDLNNSLKEGSTPSSSGSHRVHGALVVSEVSLSLVLLIGAALLLQSFIRLQRVNPGFTSENVLTIDINLPRYKYAAGHQIAAFYQQLLDRLRTLPGVQNVGAVSYLPLSGADSSTNFFIEGRPEPAPTDRYVTHHRSVSPDYFRSMGISLVRGRSFSESDTRDASRVAIINESMARRYWPLEDPIGKRLALDLEAMKFYRDRPPEKDIASALREIVGVVADVRHSRLDDKPAPEMYAPYLQKPWHDMTLVIRATSDPITLIHAARSEVLALDKEQPITNTNLLSELVAASIAQPRFNVQLMSAFAGLAVIMVIVGVYGVMSHAVSRRTHEVGIRMALGAKRADVLHLIVKQGMILVLIGVVIGVAAALSLSRFLSGMTYGVSATDPWTIVIVSLMIAAVGLLACYLPARRAAKVDPMVALRYE